MVHVIPDVVGRGNLILLGSIRESIYYIALIQCWLNSLSETCPTLICDCYAGHLCGLLYLVSIFYLKDYYDPQVFHVQYRCISSLTFGNFHYFSFLRLKLEFE